MMNKFSLPMTLLVVGSFTGNVFAGEITNKNNDMRNEVAVGYEYGFNDDYNVALEVFGQKNQNEYVVNSTDDVEIWDLNDGRADLDWATGVRLRPGYNVTQNTRVFLEGGVVLGDFSMELTDSAMGAVQYDDALSQSTMLQGLRYGVGIEHHLKDINHLSLVLDYSMTEFEPAANNTNSNMPSSAATVADFNSTEALSAPAYQQVTLSVKAEFDAGLGF
ncbi:MAG: outer membrane beta-barrel protein [Legionellales bacterium]|jgi:opacity protein-like surface antigen